MTSEHLQAVISALTSGKFYWLPPDKENPVCDVISGFPTLHWPWGKQPVVFGKFDSALKLLEFQSENIRIFLQLSEKIYLRKEIYLRLVALFNSFRLLLIFMLFYSYL